MPHDGGTIEVADDELHMRMVLTLQRLFFKIQTLAGGGSTPLSQETVQWLRTKNHDQLRTHIAGLQSCLDC